MDGEKWLPVVGFEGLYEVSDHGRVRGVDRYRPYGSGRRKVQGRVLTPPPSSDGYQRVVLHKDRRFQGFTIHRLVLTAFVGPRPDGMVCCHGDGNRANNLVENLRWDTPSENRRDAVRHKTDVNARKTHCPRGHKLGAPNVAPSALRRGSRECLACHRARDRIRYSPQLADQFKAISDEFFKELNRKEESNHE